MYLQESGVNSWYTIGLITPYERCVIARITDPGVTQAYYVSCICLRNPHSFCEQKCQVFRKKSTCFTKGNCTMCGQHFHRLQSPKTFRHFACATHTGRRWCAASYIPKCRVRRSTIADCFFPFRSHSLTTLRLALQACLMCAHLSAAYTQITAHLHMSASSRCASATWKVVNRAVPSRATACFVMRRLV